MAEEKSLQDMAAIVESLQAKVEAMGGEASQPNRFDQEREQRKAESELRRFSENDGRSGNPRPTSPRRAEELKSRSTVIPPVTTPRIQAAGGGKRAMGDTVEIVVVDNGEFKTGNFYIDGVLTLVE